MNLLFIILTMVFLKEDLFLIFQRQAHQKVEKVIEADYYDLVSNNLILFIFNSFYY